MKNYKIAVAGTGYVGLSLSVLLAQHNQVTAVDIVQAKVDMINNHPDNEILYIAHPDFKQILCNLRSRVYFVANDENDYVSREFLKALPELERYLLENVTCHPIFEVDKSKKISGGGAEIGTKLFLGLENRL